MSDKRNSARPPGGDCFEAVMIAPEGWLVLSPWIRTEDGHWWRAHIYLYGHEGGTVRHREHAEHMAREINKAMGR